MSRVIPISQASPVLTSAIAKKFDELQLLKVNNFFRSWFSDEISKVRYPIIEVRRGTKKVAVDVIRGHQGERVQITKFTQKAFDPFYFKLKFDATELDCYYRAFSSDGFAINAGAELANAVAIHNDENEKMISRAEEYFCAQVMDNGTCTSLRDGSIINFDRQAGSMVTLNPGELWTDEGVDPMVAIKAAGDWIMHEGNASGGVLNSVWGDEVWAAFRSNPEWQKKLLQPKNMRDVLKPAQRESNGAVYQGEFDCDNYTLRVWTYKDYFDKPTESYPGSGVWTYTKTAYWDPKKICFMPETTMFTMLYGAIPQVVMPGTATTSLVAAKRVFKDFPNAEDCYHNFTVESSPLPVPVTVDMMYTLKPIL